MPKANRVGLNRVTGKYLTDWDHCVQSLLDIFTTHIGTRVMRLDYGSGDMALLDRPGNKQVIALFYSTLVSAILQWEPGFRVTQFQVVVAGADGQFTFAIVGIFYPRGHLGDYSISQDMTAQFTLNALGGIVAVGAPP